MYFYAKYVLVGYFQFECFINCSFWLFHYIDVTAYVRRFNTGKVL